MTTYTKETALYDTGKIGTDISNAESTATSYFTDISSGGVFVHEEDPSKPQPSGATSNGVKITDKVDIIRGGESIASYGESTRIGRTESGYSKILLDPASETNVFQVITGNDVAAHTIYLDPNNVSTIIKKINTGDKYVGNGIGSASNPITTSYSADVTSTFTVPELSNFGNGDTFSVTLAATFSVNGDTSDCWIGNASFTKATSGSAQTNTNTDFIVSENRGGVFVGTIVRATSTIKYYPSTNVIELTYKVKQTQTTQEKYWVESCRIDALRGEVSNTIIPENQLYGDVYLNAYGDSNDYNQHGKIYCGMDDYNIGSLSFLINYLSSAAPSPYLHKGCLNLTQLLTTLTKNTYTYRQDGIWRWKRYLDGTFEAWRVSDSGSTGSLTQVGSSGTYYGTATNIPFPMDLGITEIDSCCVTVAPQSNYIMGSYINRLTTSSVYVGFMRWGSSQAVSNIQWRLHIAGKWDMPT